MIGPDAAMVVDCARGTLRAFGREWRCAIGRAGAVQAAAKREGDGATPLGTWMLRGALVRPDCGLEPPTGLPWRWLRPGDGWCDDPASPLYNRPIAHPFSGSAERLWRDDAAYDVIVVLAHNDAPPVPGLGSAIFWHLAQPDWRATEGCVAIAREAMADILPRLERGMALSCTPGDTKP